MPLAMIINSSKLRAAGFTLRKVFPSQLEAAACCRSMCGAGIRQLECIGPKRFMWSVDDDTYFKSRCVYLCTSAWFFNKKKRCAKMSINPHKKIARAPHTPKCLGTVVLAHPDRVLSPQAHLKLNLPHQTKRERQLRISQTKADCQRIFLHKAFHRICCCRIKQCVDNNPNAILTRQIYSQRSNMSAGGRHRALAFFLVRMLAWGCWQRSSTGITETMTWINLVLKLRQHNALRFMFAQFCTRKLQSYFHHSIERRASHPTIPFCRM